MSSEISNFGEQYLDWMSFTHKSPTTIVVRRRNLTYFFTWCEERSLCGVDDIVRPVLERYQKYLYNYRKKSGTALTISTQRSRLVALRSFFKWMARQRFIMHNPAADIEMPKEGLRLPRSVLTLEEVGKIMMLPDLSSPCGLRDRAMLEVLYSCGIRRSEVSKLTLYDYDALRGVLMIREAKGRKDRVVPIGEHAGKYLQKYIDEARDELLLNSVDQCLFVTSQGKQFHADSLTKLVRNYVLAADIQKKGSCHIFRHTAATLMFENGADIRYIQQMLGHADISTTQIYTKVSIKQLKNVHDITHPGNIQKPQQGTEPIQKPEPPAFI